VQIIALDSRIIVYRAADRQSPVSGNTTVANAEKTAIIQHLELENGFDQPIII